jgi:thioredoxin reductase (NADPH)
MTEQSPLSGHSESQSDHRSVAIIGSGPAGLTAAIYTARAGLSPILFHGPLPGGQLTTTTEVENFPGFPEGIQGPDLMKNMEYQARRFGTEILQELITKIDLKQRPFLISSSNRTLTCDAVILASGATPKSLGIPGEKELTGFGVSTCATCDGAFFRNQVIAVSGGGDSACEEAHFLTRFGEKVYLIHRRDELRASKIMQDRVMANPKIEVLWNTQVTSVIGSREHGVTGLLLKNTIDGSSQELPCAALFVAIGHSPNSGLVRDYLETDANGYVKVKPNSTQTSIPGVFVCGDVQDHVFRQAITAAGTGCMAAIEAERFLAEIS